MTIHRNQQLNFRYFKFSKHAYHNSLAAQFPEKYLWHAPIPPVA